MYHSLWIDGKNTYDDFGLIPTSRPVINPPEPQFSYLEVPGMSGVIDMSESLTGHITYSNRTGSIEFLVKSEKDWSSLYSELMSFLHGKKMRIVLEDDPLYYYEGRLSVSSWKSNKNNSSITIDYDLFPFKYETTKAIDGYLVYSGYAQEKMSFFADQTSKVIEMIVVCEQIGVTALLDGERFVCKKGENILPILQVKNEKSCIQIGGTGKITVKYRKGRL